MSRIFRLSKMMLFLLQAVAAIRLVLRLASTSQGKIIHRAEVSEDHDASVTILIPVLNEVQRLTPCLDGVLAQGSDVAEIIVIDGGSSDGTQALVQRYTERDSRLRLIEAESPPNDINGKAWQLQAGFEAANPEIPWILTLDADVRPEPLLVRSLLAHVQTNDVSALSVATRQQLSGTREGLIHPAMLATLVYRFGIPGHATSKIGEVQSNGQCFLARREVLDSVSAFSGAANSVCEDVTLARAIAAAGNKIGFYESDDLISVEMYAGWREAWDNWTRSLPMRDRFSRVSVDTGLFEVLLTQALPIWIVALSARFHASPSLLNRLNLGLFFVRIGVLAGMARAYRNCPWTYWLSPLADLPVTLRISFMSRKSRHNWRGREFASGESR